MREILMLRAKWRELETEPRTWLNGHEGGNPGYSQASVLTGHRASSRPYIAFPLPICRSLSRIWLKRTTWPHNALFGEVNRYPAKTT